MGSYVHFDSVAASQVTVAASGADGDDPSITYYLLNWNGNAAGYGAPAELPVTAHTEATEPEARPGTA